MDFARYGTWAKVGVFGVAVLLGYDFLAPDYGAESDYRKVLSLLILAVVFVLIPEGEKI